MIETFENKMPALVLIRADTRLNSDLKEEFWFNQAYVLSNSDVYVFLDLIRKGIIVADLGMYVQENGAVRNRGVRVRIEDRFLNLCFGSREKIVRNRFVTSLAPAKNKVNARNAMRELPTDWAGFT